MVLSRNLLSNLGRIALGVLAIVGLAHAEGQALHLLIDRSNPAYVVFTHVPAANLAEARKVVAGTSGQELKMDADVVRVVGEEWDRVVVAPAPFDPTLRKQLPELLARMPGAILGLTWDGGMVVTYTDYRHAERTYAEWKEDPAAYTAKHSPSSAKPGTP